MTWRRLFSTWLLLAVLMPMNGALREFGFKRVMSDATAEVLSVVTGILVVLATTFAVFRAPSESATWQLVLVALAATPFLWRGRR